MDFLREDARAMHEGAGKETIADTRGAENMETAGAADNYSMMSEEDYSASEEDLPFEPYDINNDGLIIKTASRCSRGSWKRPEVGWDVVVTIHRFCELTPLQPAKGGGGTQEEGEEPSQDCTPTPYTSEVEPDLEIGFTLGQYRNNPFPQEALSKATSAVVELHPLLHCGIETMGKSERATFVVTEDATRTRENDDNSAPPPRRLEYDISLDDWAEEIDLSEKKDGSLVKRVARDGDGSTKPVDIAVVTIRCRVTRTRAPDDSPQQGDGEPEHDEMVLVDNLQSQDDPVDHCADLQRPLTFVLDECPFGPGFLTVLKSMHEGEVCEAWLNPMHGPVDRSDNGHFFHHVTIELVEVEELPPVWDSADVRVEMSTRFKLEGNEKFVAGDYVRALRRYEKAIRYADGVPPGKASDGDDGERSNHPDDTHADHPQDGPDTKNLETDGKDTTDGINATDSQEEGVLVDLQVAVLCNQAACHLKMGEGACAVEVADRAAKLKAPGDSPAGIKATYRLACALEAVGDWDEARIAFKSVLDADPKNGQCLQGLVRLARAEKAYNANLRKTFGGFLGSNNKLQGFASEGREDLAPRQPGSNGQGGFDGRGPMAEDDGPWSDGSSSETDDSGEESDDVREDTSDEEDSKTEEATKEDGKSEETTKKEDGKREEATSTDHLESSSSAVQGINTTPTGGGPEAKPEAEPIEKNPAAVAGEAEASMEEAKAAPAPAPELAEEVEVGAGVGVPEAVATEAAPASEPVAGESGVCCSSSPSLSTGTIPVGGVEEVIAGTGAETVNSKEKSLAGIVNVKERCAIEVGLQDGADATPLPTPP